MRLRILGVLSVLAWAAGALALGHVSSCATVPTTAAWGVPITADVFYKSDTPLSAIVYRQSFRDSDLVFTGPVYVQLLAPYDAACLLTVTVGTAADYLVQIDCGASGALLGDSAAHPLYQFRYVANEHDQSDLFMLSCTTNPATTCDAFTQPVTITG